MKKTIVKGLITVLALGGAPLLALAETGVNANIKASVNLRASTTTPRPLKEIQETRKEAKEEIKDIRQNLASTTKAIRTDAREDVKDKIENRNENRYRKMIARFQATIEREESILARIVSRIEKIKTAGGNVTEAERLSAEAKVHIEAAKVSLASLKVLAEAQASLETSSSAESARKDGHTAMKKVIAELEMHLRAGHKSLQKIIGVLRGVSQLKTS